MSRINFVPLIKQEGLQNAIVRNKKEPSPLIGYAKRIETYDDIVSLPSNANGQISVTIKGKTVTQMLKNGNFKNGTTDWIVQNATNFTVTNGIAEFTATASYGRLAQFIYVIKGHKYYIVGYVKADSNTVHIDIAGIGKTYYSGSGNWEKLATTLQWTADSGYFPYGIRDSRSSNWTMIQVTNCMVIDLTAHGLDNASVSELNDMFPYYIDYGTKSTINGAVKAIGKNLFNINKNTFRILGANVYKLDNGIKVKSTTSGQWTSVDYLYKLKPNTTYYLNYSSVVHSGEAYVIVYNNLYVSLRANTGTFTTDSTGITIFRFHATKSVAAIGEVDYINIQLEEGTQATAYEPYKETVAYMPNIVLRSLPNNVKDEICVTEGKHIQRVGVKTNVASGTVINYSDMATGGQFVAYAADGTMQVGAKGDTLTITAVMLLYQLATPIVTQADVFGDLKAFPGGTIYFEPTLWGFINFDYGQNSKVITTPDVPIGSIRKVIRYDITDDGRLVATDVTADCTHNGTTLTIANAEPKKTYFYDCEIAPGYYTSAEKIIDVSTHDGVVEHDYGAAAADWVLSTNEALATMLVCKNAGGAAKIIAPAAEGKMYIIRNVSGQTITIKTASSTGITVANGKTATVIFYNTDFIKIGEV